MAYVSHMGILRWSNLDAVKLAEDMLAIGWVLSCCLQVQAGSRLGHSQGLVYCISVPLPIHGHGNPPDGALGHRQHGGAASWPNTGVLHSALRALLAGKAVQSTFEAEKT